MPKKKQKQTAPKILIDGDIFAYRASFSCEDESLEDAIDKVDDLLTQAIEDILWEPSESDYKVFLTGKGNYRYDYAVSHPYKGNRKDVEKPKHLAGIRKHLVKNWKAVVSNGEEADDLIGIEATKNLDDTIIVSVDKDMLQIPCGHYNPTKGKFTKVSEFEGLKFFYTQILTGDRADNIVGLYGVGPAKAKKMLDDCDNEACLYEECLRAYGGEEERVVENGVLLWLRRHPNQIWEPPKCVIDQD